MKLIIVLFTFLLEVFCDNDSELDIHILPSQKYRLTPRDVMSIKSEVEGELMSKFNEIESNYNPNQRINIVNQYRSYLGRPSFTYAPNYVYNYQKNNEQQRISKNHLRKEEEEKKVDINISEDLIVDLLSLKRKMQKEIEEERNNNDVNKRKVIGEIAVSKTKDENGNNYLINKATNEIATIKMNPVEKKEKEDNTVNHPVTIDDLNPKNTIEEDNKQRGQITEMIKRIMKAKDFPFITEDEMNKMPLSDLFNLYTLISQSPEILN